MKILELITFVESRVNGVYFYANSIPLAAPDACGIIKLTGGFPPSQWTGKKQPSFQIIIRNAASKQAECEAQAYAVHEALMNLRNVTIGDDSVVIIRAINSVPIFIGYDENRRPLYSMNFDCVVRP